MTAEPRIKAQVVTLQQQKSQSILKAIFEARSYSFSLVKSEKDKVTVQCYDTIYQLIHVGQGWENAPSNRFSMSEGLIAGVIEELIAQGKL
jgi:hypothetical protein